MINYILTLYKNWNKEIKKSKHRRKVLQMQIKRYGYNIK